LGPDLRLVIEDKLRDEVLNTQTGRYGFVVAIVGISSVGEGFFI
jgi:DNA-directed RNA polymerase subunit E'/Rpb7